jgi:Protein of unknown function (DUF3263)
VENVRTIAGSAAPRIPPGPATAGGAVPHGPAPTQDAGPLGERERRVLAFERQWWRHAGAKEEAIRREFGVGPTAYYQLLSRLIDDPAAIAHDPMLVKRLQRQRASRRRRRSGARLAGGGGSELSPPGTRTEGSTLPAKPTS